MTKFKGSPGPWTWIAYAAPDPKNPSKGTAMHELRSGKETVLTCKFPPGSKDWQAILYVPDMVEALEETLRSAAFKHPQARQKVEEALSKALGNGPDKEP